MRIPATCWHWLFTLSFFWVTAPVALAGTPEKIVLLMEESHDERGQPQALPDSITRLLAFIGQQAGLEFEIVPLPWSRALSQTRNGAGLVFGISKTTQRLTEFDYSEPVWVAPIWAISYGTTPLNLHSKADLRGKTVSIRRGVSHGIEFERGRNNLFKVEEDPSSQLIRFRKLAAHRSDVLLLSLRQFEHAEQVHRHVRQVIIPGLHAPELNPALFHVAREPLFYDTVHFAVGKGKYHAQLGRLNRALLAASRSGELARLVRGEAP
jgi:ABC-type amino acid transport substrate-binding protein